MPAAVASPTRSPGKNPRPDSDPLPPAKKTKLSQPAPAPPRPNGYAALLDRTPSKEKPTVAAKVNSARNVRKHQVDEATAVVGGGGAGHGDVDMADAGKEVIEISSAEEASDYSSSEDDGPEEAAAGSATPITNGHATEVEAEDHPVDHGTAEPEEPSFGERLQEQDPGSTHASHLVDVEAAFAGPEDPPRTLTTTSAKRTLTAPSATSLGTVLSQALRTNDKDLLDSCLRVMDPGTVYNTVERLPSPLVGSLLQKLAERLYSRPGRAGILMVWVQWSLAAHGGYLASQPQLVQQLATLNRVLKERASGLQPLLSLKGRLDMLHAQLELRKRNQRRAADDDEKEAVIYVEGEDDVSSAEEDDQSVGGSNVQFDSAINGIRQDSNMEDESSADEMPTTMEVDEGSDEGSEDSEGLLDEEAEETDNDTGDDMSEPMSDGDLDDGEDISESDEGSKPARRSTAGRAGVARRY